MSITPDCREISQEELDAIVAERDTLRTEVQRLQGDLDRLREIEVSEEVYGVMSAHGNNGSVLITGEFRSGREFCEKFRATPRPTPPQAATGSNLESLIHAVAMAAWDHGAECGIVWCPDADMTKRGVVPMTQEEGLEHSRAHFVEHGDGSPVGPFNAALQALRDALHSPPQAQINDAEV